MHVCSVLPRQAAPSRAARPGHPLPAWALGAGSAVGHGGETAPQVGPGNHRAKMQLGQPGPRSWVGLRCRCGLCFLTVI